MSRRRRRDEGEEQGVLSENEEGEGNRSLSAASGSEIGDELDVSDYESLEEEERNSSEDEIEGDPPNPDGKQSEQQQEKTKVILERKREEKVELSEKVELKDENAQEKEDLTTDNTKRESGDGKEESDSENHKRESERAVNNEDEKDDDDPAFIPTKGAFFQHDLRSDKQSHTRQKDRKLWDKGPTKWSHDMFIMEEQMPKSRAILVSNYGYDIREHPVDRPPPQRKPRGRGHGRGTSRGNPPVRTRTRTRNFSREKRYHDEDEQASDYRNEYPTLDKEDSNSSKHKTKSYYNTQRYGKSKENEAYNSMRSTRSTDSPKGASSENSDQVTSSVSRPSENDKEEKLNDILQVIQNHEKVPPREDNMSSQPTSATSRRGDRPARGRQNAPFSRYNEPQKPKRYSSLRQKQSDNTLDHQNVPIPPLEQKYANFSKPIQPNSAITSNFSQASIVTGSKLNVDQIGNSNQNIQVPRTIKEHGQPFSQSQVSMQRMQQNVPPSVSQTPMNVQSLPFQDLSPNVMGAQMDPSLLRMPQMLPMYNPVMNSSYFDAALNQQQMMRMMSQMNMSMEQMPPSMPAPMNPSAGGMPPDPQTLPHPGAALAPPVSQTLSPGSLGSVMRPPHASINPSTYFSGPMNYNMTQQQQPPSQAPLGYHPNLLPQQFGGVTYFNTPNQPGSVLPLSNQASPRRNAAIPIVTPTGFAGPAVTPTGFAGPAGME